MSSEPQPAVPQGAPTPPNHQGHQPPPPGPPPRRRRWPWFLLFLLFISLAMNVLQSSRSRSARYYHPGPQVEERFHSLSPVAEDKIAILTVEGAIIAQDGFIKQQIDQIREDKQVKAIVLRVNSPGGTVTASDYLYHHLRQLREDRDLPLVVSMGSVAASGAYYISMAVGDDEDTIYAEPTTWSGSIGVIIPHFDLSGLMKSWEIADDSIKSGPLKQMGSPTHPMTEEERKVFEVLVSESFERFKGIVVAGRPALGKDEEKLKQATTGQVFTTEQAIDIGLVDREGFIEAAIERAVELAGLTPETARAVQYTQPAGLFGPLLSQAAEGRRSDLAQLLDLTAPRAYYLHTMLPAWDALNAK